WEREWESPLKGGDSEAFDRARSVDQEIAARGGEAAEERQVAELLRRAEADARDRERQSEDVFWDDEERSRPYGDGRVREGIAAAARALSELAPRVQPDEVRRQVEAVVALLRSLAPELAAA